MHVCLKCVSSAHEGSEASNADYVRGSEVQRVDKERLYRVLIRGEGQIFELGNGPPPQTCVGPEQRAGAPMP